MSDLRPCPFCGAEAHFKSETDPMPPFKMRAWIKCLKCWQAQVCSDWYQGDLGTMEAAWNKRAE